MTSVLVIEDEKDLASVLEFNLIKEGFQPVVVHDGSEGLQKALTGSFDLILLDLMLPAISGVEVCKRIRKDERTSVVPVIIITARGEEIDRVVGFEIGADDYVVKPFSIRELMLRIKAVLKRTSSSEKTSGQITVGPITLDTERHKVSVDGQEIPLTTTEFKLLLNLAQRPGRLQGREVLLQNVWGYSFVGDTRTVDTHVTRLRAKLGSAGELIKTIRGFGYKLEAE